MKLAFIFLLLVIPLLGEACDGNVFTRHTNPDGSEGGLVNKDAKVEASVHIDHTAKVCDKAWVDGNARILGYAIVKEDAWVREYSTVKDRASVGGKSVVQGTRNTPVMISDDSRVYGSAKILTGTRISDRSEIFGNVSIRDSQITGTARVCEGYIISDQSIDDNYFCREGEEEKESRAQVELISYNEDHFNKISDRIIFEIKDYRFLLDRNVFQILINGQQVNPGNIDVGHTRLVVNSSSLIVDGENEIKFLGRDEFNKILPQSYFHFIVGLGSRTIQVQQQDNSQDPKIRTNVSFIYEGREYKGLSKYKNGEIIVEGVPENLTDVEFKIKGIGSRSFFVESYSSINQIPISFNATAIPPYQNNYTDFSHGLEGWSVSHIDNIQIATEGDSTKVKVSPNQFERVELTKTIRLSKVEKGFGVRFNINSHMLRLYDGSEKIQIVLASAVHGQIEVFNYTLEQMRVFGKQDGQEDLIIQIPHQSPTSSEYTVLIRLFPSESSNLSQETWLDLIGIAVSTVYIDFQPMNFSPLNKEELELSPTYPLDEMKCLVRTYDRNINLKYENTEVELPFFSAGITSMMPNFRENRIYGRLHVIGVPRSKIRNLWLIGLQNGVEKFNVELAACSKSKLSASAPEYPIGEIFNISHGKNLVHHLFSIPALDLLAINTTIGSGNDQIGDEISLKVRGEFLDLVNSFTYESNIRNYKILSSPHLPSAATFNPSISLEDYDNSYKGILRTGGDKWIRPAYASVLMNLISLHKVGDVYTWLVNDLSKLNGGHFEPHRSHDTGFDADVMFPKINGVQTNLTEDRNKDEWRSLLEHLENFLDKNNAYNGYITDYLLTVKNIPSEKFIEKRLKNRCLGDRFVSLTDELGTGSLVRDYEGHVDHFHIKFNELEDDGKAQNKPRQIPVDADLNDFWFTIKDENDRTELTITPKEEVKDEFENRVILWRFQDKEGFDDPGLIVDFGQWPLVVKEKNLGIMKRPSVHRQDVLKFIYVTVGNKESGWCVQRKVEIDQSLFKRKETEELRWTYVKTPSGYVSVFQ